MAPMRASRSRRSPEAAVRRSSVMSACDSPIVCRLGAPLPLLAGASLSADSRGRVDSLFREGCSAGADGAVDFAAFHATDWMTRSVDRCCGMIIVAVLFIAASRKFRWRPPFPVCPQLTHPRPRPFDHDAEMGSRMRQVGWDCGGAAVG